MKPKISLVITGGSQAIRLDSAKKIAAEEKIPSNSPDFIIIQPENSIGIEKLREILPVINLKPYQSPKKIIIVNDAFKLTAEAQNAFLKTLEEPPPNTIIILLVQNPDQLLPTIISRCQIMQINETTPTLNSSNINNNFIKIEKEVSEIKNMPIGLKFKKAAEIAVNRDSAKAWLQNAIYALHQNVIQNAKVFEKFQKALIKIDQNVNPKLVIENLLIDL